MPFAPSDIANLVFWLEADMVTGLTDGDSVVTVTEQSANAYALVAAAGKPTPKWDEGAVNTHAAFDFNSTFTGQPAGQRLKTSADIVPHGGLTGSPGDSCTIFVVQKQTAATPGGATFSLLATSFTNQFAGFLGLAGDLYFRTGDATSGGDNVVAVPVGWDDTYHIVELWRGGGTGQVGEIKVDNTLLLSSTFASFITGASGFPLVIGENDATGETLPFAGQIAALIIYNRALNSTERTNVYGYLFSTYFAAAYTVDPSTIAAAGSVPSPAVDATYGISPLTIAAEGSVPTFDLTSDPYSLIPTTIAAEGSVPSPAVSFVVPKGIRITISDRLAQG